MNAQGGEQTYGEYFPYSMSLFPFNDSDAMLFLPLAKDEAQKRGASWEEETEAEGKATISWDSVPLCSKDVAPTITAETLLCKTSGNPFRITTKELEACKWRSLPLPREHWRVRLLKRQSLINPPTLYRRTCERSGKQILSSWPANTGWKVWSNEEFIRMFQ